MALANPLPRDAFADRLRVQDVQFVQGFQQQRSATGGGETRMPTGRRRYGRLT